MSTLVGETLIPNQIGAGDLVVGDIILGYLQPHCTYNHIAVVRNVGKAYDHSGYRCRMFRLLKIDISISGGAYKQLCVGQYENRRFPNARCLMAIRHDSYTIEQLLTSSNKYNMELGLILNMRRLELGLV